MRSCYWRAAFALAAALSCGCGGGGASSVASGTASIRAARLPNAAIPLVTPTYDGSGQVVHPGIVFVPGGWHGYSYWLAVAPYPNDDASKEDTSILASADGTNWVVPAGLVNPIDQPTYSHLADPDLFYDAASDQLWAYYIEAAQLTHVWRQTSSDGVHWSPGEDLFQTPSYDCLSPAIEKLGSNYLMWSVNTGPSGYNTPSSTVELRTSLDGGIWSAPQAVNITQPGYVIWHLDAKYIPSKNELWMLFAAYPQGKDSAHTILFFAKSTDGMNWTTYNREALAPVPGSWDAGNIYRSTLLYDDATDMLRIWYSARGGPAGNEWHIGYTQGSYVPFLAALQ